MTIITLAVPLDLADDVRTAVERQADVYDDDALPGHHAPEDVLALQRDAQRLRDLAGQLDDEGIRKQVAAQERALKPRAVAALLCLRQASRTTVGVRDAVGDASGNATRDLLSELRHDGYVEHGLGAWHLTLAGTAWCRSAGLPVDGGVTHMAEADARAKAARR